MARRRRRERIAGVVLAVVGVAVLVVAVIALRDPKNPSTPQSAGTSTRAGSSSSSSRAPSGSTSSASSRTSSSTSSTSPASTRPTVAQFKADFPLVVLNNTTTQGLAAEAAQRFEQGGWKVSSYGNLENSILSTCAYYDPSVQYARAAALELQREYPTIQRVEPKFSGLQSGPVVVVLTPDYSNG